MIKILVEEAKKRNEINWAHWLFGQENVFSKEILAEEHPSKLQQYL